MLSNKRYAHCCKISYKTLIGVFVAVSKVSDAVNWSYNETIGNIWLLGKSVFDFQQQVQLAVSKYTRLPCFACACFGEKVRFFAGVISF